MSKTSIDKMIQLNHVKFGYSDTEVLDEINLTINEGEYVVLIGENGSGKSTLMRLILGELKPDEGEIIIMDNDSKLKKQIGYVAQNGISKNQSFPATVEEIMVTGLYQELGLFHLPNRKHKKKIKDTLKEFGMDEFLKRRIGELSGGQQQRVALARILASDPEVLMLDEPFSALDAFLKEKLQLELLELLSGYDKDILMVTHSRDEIYRFCEHMLIVEDGRQAGFGITKEIFKNPGTPAAAKLTGCKNIEKIERVDDHTMVLPNWNTTVCVKGMIPENTTHIGIRAHYLRLPENGQRENLVECQNGKILDDPFELVVVFEHDVWWKIPKESWQKEYQEKMPQYLAIPEESILYLHG